MFPKMSEYVKCSDESKYISFSIKDGELAEKYNKTWNKVSNIIKKGFDKRTVYDAKYISTKIKSYNGKINTNFHSNKILKEDSQSICSSVILMESVFRTSKN